MTLTISLMLSNAGLAIMDAFTAGSSISSDMPDIKDKLQTSLDNLRVAKEYLGDRFWKVAQDTTTINIASEIGFGAGAASNKIADGYMDGMVVTEGTKNQQEKLNLDIFKQTAREPFLKFGLLD